MNDKLKDIIITIIFLIIILGILIINIIKEDTIISISERRKLATFPKISISGIIDGTVIDKFEDYTMDQMAFRDWFRKLKTMVEFYVFGKNDVNDLYEYNESIIKQEYPLNEKSVANIVNKINNIKQMYLNDTNQVYFSIVPDKNYFVDGEYLKMDYSKMEQIMKNGLKDIEYIDIFDCLKLEDYYYTDTHWKQENLKKVSDKIARKMNFDDRLNSKYDVKQITEFDGVYVGQLQIDTKKDSIKVLTNDIIENCTVYNYETNETSKIYNLEKLNSNDKYDIYLSGATPLLVIENKAAKTDKELIVFRDSFASSLIPLFAEAYKTITVVDTRYIAGSMVGQYITDFTNKDVLFIYSTLIINSSYTLK